MPTRIWLGTSWANSPQPASSPAMAAEWPRKKRHQPPKRKSGNWKRLRPTRQRQRNNMAPDKQQVSAKGGSASGGKEVKAFARYIHTSPRKLRLVADMIKKHSVDEALQQ